MDNVDLEKRLQILNEASLAIVAVHTAENEPLKLLGCSFSYSVTFLIGTLPSLKIGLGPVLHRFCDCTAVVALRKG